MVRESGTSDGNNASTHHGMLVDEKGCCICSPRNPNSPM